MTVIDPWINVDMPEWSDVDWMVTVFTEYFSAGREAMVRLSVDETVELLDRNSVDKAVLDIDGSNPSAHTLAVADALGDRVRLGVRLDVRKPVEAVAQLRDLASGYTLANAKLIPFVHDIPADAAVCYPVYLACLDLGLPVTINASVAGPPMPSECQYPMHLDRVCLDFPDLTVVMAHGAEPWWDLAIRLMLKYKNMHLMTSAHRPKHLPESLLHYMRTRGKTKVIFSSDFPILPLELCLDDVKRLELPDDVRANYLGLNAERIFFGPRVGR